MQTCAIIGLRSRGRTVLREALACPDLAVVALCDSDPARLAEAGALAPDARRHTEANAVFADPGIDAVVLVLPNHLHERLGLAALAAGKHVLLEKPMGRNAAECQRLIAGRDAARRTLMICYQQRFGVAALQARAILASGAIGPIHQASTRWNRRCLKDNLWGRGDWFLDPHQSGGGPMLDLGVHKLDLCLDLLGYPIIERCLAIARHGLGRRAGETNGRDYAIEDAFDAWLFGDGIDIRVESSFFRNQEQEEFQELVLLGEHGGLRLDDAGLQAWSIDAAGTCTALPLPALSGCGALQHFADAIHGRCSVGPDGEQSLALQLIVDACYRSSQQDSRLIDLRCQEARV